MHEALKRSDKDLEPVFLNVLPPFVQHSLLSRLFVKVTVDLSTGPRYFAAANCMKRLRYVGFCMTTTHMEQVRRYVRAQLLKGFWNPKNRNFISGVASACQSADGKGDEKKTSRKKPEPSPFKDSADEETQTPNVKKRKKSQHGSGKKQKEEATPSPTCNNKTKKKKRSRKIVTKASAKKKIKKSSDLSGESCDVIPGFESDEESLDSRSGGDDDDILSSEDCNA